MTELLVIHDLGAAGGAPWADAFIGWDGGVVAPDLPGHGVAPPPVGGHHELGDVVFAMVDHLPSGDRPQPVVVGIGRSGNAARLLALAGRASALVLVDGLGGPWLDVRERNAAFRTVRRRILMTPEALRAPAPGAVDPRAEWLPGQTDRPHVVSSLAALPVPTLVIESPASPTPDADEVAASIPDHHLVRVADASPPDVADWVTDWVAGRLTTRSTVPPH